MCAASGLPEVAVAGSRCQTEQRQQRALVRRLNQPAGTVLQLLQSRPWQAAAGGASKQQQLFPYWGLRHKHTRLERGACHPLCICCWLARPLGEAMRHLHANGSYVSSARLAAVAVAGVPIDPHAIDEIKA